MQGKLNRAYYQSVSQKRTPAAACENQEPGVEVLPSKARGLSSSLYLNPQEAELGLAKSGARTVDERYGSDNVHPWRRTQPARTLHCFGARRSRKGFARGALPHRPRCAGCGRCDGSKAGSLEVRRETPQVGSASSTQGRKIETYATK